MAFLKPLLFITLFAAVYCAMDDSKPLAPEKSDISLCPGSMTQCGAGCCPLRNAVCCSDGVHCCPSGFTCNYAAGGCTRGRMQSPFLEKMVF